MKSPDGFGQLADGVASAVHWTLPGTNVKAYDENEKVDNFNPFPWDELDPRADRAAVVEWRALQRNLHSTLGRGTQMGSGLGVDPAGAFVYFDTAIDTEQVVR